VSSGVFEYVPVRAGGAPVALVPPMLALGLQQKLPAVVTPPPVDLNYATQFGPLLAVAADRYAWHVDGLGKYVQGQPTPGPATAKSRVLEAELAAEVDKVLTAGHLAPWDVCRQAPWTPTYDGTTYGTDPSEVLYLLSEVLPLLPEAQQTRVREYLIHEAATYPPDQVLRLKSAEGARREFGLNAPMSGNEGEYHEGVPSLYRANGVARYYRATQQTPPPAVLAFWRQAMRESLTGRDWATLGWFWGKYAVLECDQRFRAASYRSDYWQFTPRHSSRCGGNDRLSAALPPER